MGRSANCIRMLLLLKARGMLSKEELAEQLHTNVRNITEYRRELEHAGYQIETISGKYGGYRLKSGALFPVVALSRQELQAVFEAQRYMSSHPDFLLLKEFQRSMDKLLATTSMPHRENGYYVERPAIALSARMREYIRIMEQARDAQLAIDIAYRGMKASAHEWVRVFPYELLNDNGSYYCLGYSLKAKDYRKYKFSEERMQQLRMSTQRFQRDKDFRIRDHIGEGGLMQSERYELELLVEKESALLISEKQPGAQVEMRWEKEDVLHYRCVMEGRLQVVQFLLSLGTQVHLLQPKSLKKELAQIAAKMQQRYSADEDCML